jgi:hypothetical protein
MGFQGMNKRGLQLQNAFYALIVFSVIMISIGIVINSSSSYYNSGVTSDLGSLNRLNEVSGEVNTQTTKLSPTDPDPGQDAESNTFRGVYGIISNIYSPFKQVFGQDGIIDELSFRFGIPDYVRIMLISMILIAFTMALVGIIFRLGRTP